MSRTKKTIQRPFQFEKIRDVTLNRAGKIIGFVAKFTGKIVYVSPRSKQHYFIKERGFGIDRGMLKSLIMEDRIDLIIIRYTGPRGTRYYISTIDDWLGEGVNVAYSKDTGGTIETYGSQKILSEKFMDEYIVR